MLKQPKNIQIIFFQSSDPPKICMVFSTMFHHFETAETTAATAAVAVYYVKTA